MHTKLKWLGLSLLAIVAACSGSPSPTTPSPNGAGPPAGPVTILAAGDIAWCPDLTAAEQTARILDANPGTILALGDLAYMRGTAQQFHDCYTPTWGRHRSRTRPVPGNHEYESMAAGPYFDYFEDMAGTPGEGYYSFSAGRWQVIALNSNLPMGRGSPQYTWLEGELRQASRCTLAYWHHPRFSSGPNGDSTRSAAIWELLYLGGADVVLAGHDHAYERFLPMNPDGQLDRERGVRQFVAGSGGAELYRFASVKPNSASRYEGHGVLKLVLGDGRYEWEFLPVTRGFADIGFDSCH